jgi:hypothetical protein
MPSANLADFGMVSGGSEATNDTALADHRDWAEAQSGLVETTLNPGTYAITEGRPFANIPLFKLNALGATFNLGNALRLSTAGGFVQRAGFSARVSTIRRGDTSAICTTVAQASRFPAGRWIALTALDWQGDQGFPQNHHYVEYTQVVSANPTTGVVTYYPPATQDYLSTFPETTTGDYDAGGPATLFLMDHPVNGDPSSATSWDCDVTINGLRVVNLFGQPGEQVYYNGRRVVLNFCNFVDCAPIPSQNELAQHNFVTCNFEIELDKEIVRAEYNNCSLQSMKAQSSSVQNLIISATSFTNGLTGTARRTVIMGGSVIPSFKLGRIGYGTSEDVIIKSSTINGLLFDNTAKQLITDFSVSNGRLTFNGNGVSDVLPMGAPGALLFLGGSSRTNGGYPTLVSAVEASAAKAVLVTDFADPIPTLPDFMGSPFYVTQHPCPSISVYDSDGCDAMDELTLAPKGLPYGSYIFRTGDFSAAPTDTIVFGVPILWRVKVVRAYTGAQGACVFHSASKFDNTQVVKADGTAGTIGAALTVDATVVGETFFTSIDGWLVDGISPQLNIDVTGEAAGLRPIIEIEIQTVQLPAGVSAKRVLVFA